MHRLGRGKVVGLGVHGATVRGGEWDVLEEDEMIEDDCGVEVVEELSRHMVSCLCLCLCLCFYLCLCLCRHMVPCSLSFSYG